MGSWSLMVFQLLTIMAPCVILLVLWFIAHLFLPWRVHVSTRGMGRMSSNPSPSLHFYFSVFFLSLLYSFVFLLIYSLLRPLKAYLRYSSHRRVFRLVPPYRLLCAATHSGGRESLTLYFSESPGCSEG